MRTIIITCISALLLLASVGVSARGYGYGHHGFRHYGHHGHQSGHAGYFIGGLLLGTILAPPRYAPPPRVVYVPQPTYVVPRVSYAPQAHAPVGRRLLRDIDGNCFERKVDARGNELRTQLAAAECAW
ncbi:MAG: hypothetical protein QF609_09295 [Gammaproteobacteria bacterium]|nr:hypothetical protein [Gammaproteobacteria bacterium]HJP35355.1 hypothetical protein [Gammaproteobacteria bacterium]